MPWIRDNDYVSCVTIPEIVPLIQTLLRPLRTHRQLAEDGKQWKFTLITVVTGKMNGDYHYNNNAYFSSTLGIGSDASIY